MLNRPHLSLLTAFFLLLLAGAAHANEKQQGPPPALVVTAKAESGTVTPYLDFIGSVYCNELSELATEVAGKVESYTFETGQKVRKGQVLVTLNADLLQKELAAKKAQLTQVQTTYAEAQKDFERMRTLFESGSVSEQDYDKKRFLRIVTENRVLSLEAELERLTLQLEKTRIKAPFEGVVLSRHVSRGEWLNTGASVAEIGRMDVLDVDVNVPERILPFVRQGMQVDVAAAGKSFGGEIYAIVPKGDIATRTFPLKIRVKNPGYLAQGMEAKVTLPSGSDEKTLVVPRDAVISVFGTLGIFAVQNGQAMMLPVEVVGYKGNLAGVRAQGLAEGMDVVVKGNERLRPGQPVTVRQ